SCSARISSSKGRRKKRFEGLRNQGMRFGRPACSRPDTLSFNGKSKRNFLSAPARKYVSLVFPVCYGKTNAGVHAVKVAWRIFPGGTRLLPVVPDWYDGQAPRQHAAFRAVRVRVRAELWSGVPCSGGREILPIVGNQPVHLFPRANRDRQRVLGRWKGATVLATIRAERVVGAVQVPRSSS